jgi:hypothetical protein
MAVKNVTLLETLGDYVIEFNGLGSDVGDLTLLTTSTKASVVAATNSLKTRIDNADSNIGSRSSLVTTNKLSLVAAINELALTETTDSSEVIILSRKAVSVSDAGGDGSLSYDSGTGVFTYTGPSASEVRAKISVTDAGGDGSLSYNSGTGVITYVGPSASEVRAHLSAGSRITYSSGQISIANGAIDSAALGSLSVTTVKIANDAVTTAKIANDAITFAKMADSSVGSNELRQAVQLIIYNSPGTALKTLFGAGE